MCFLCLIAFKDMNTNMSDVFPLVFTSLAFPPPTFMQRKTI